MEKEIVSECGGSEHFITSAVTCSSSICVYLEERNGVSTDVGDEGAESSIAL